MTLQRRHFIGRLTALGAFGGTSAFAQGVYPDRPVKVIVPYPAGGVVDVAARIAGEAITASWGQQVLVENRPGANGNLGAQAVRTATADGYTLLIGSMFLAVNPIIDRNARFTLDDFKPVAALGAAPNLLVVPASSPATTLAQFIALARKQPGVFNTPNPGAGSSNHLGLEILQQVAGIDLVQINYKGQPPFIVDLVSGQLHFAYLTSALALPHIASGKLRALAIGAHSRLAALPEVPTLAELGYADATVLPWNGVFAPASTPQPVIARLAQEVEKAMTQPEVIRRHAAASAISPQGGSADFARFVAAERVRWQRVVTERKITAEPA